MILLFAAAAWLIALGIAIRRRSSFSSSLKGQGERSDSWRDLVAIGVIGLATAGFFWRTLFGNAWMPAGGGDLANFLYPTYHFAADWLRRGVIPLWNPYLFGGQPFLGDIQSSLFYPLNLLTFLLSSPLTFRDMEYLSVLHFAIAGTGMYAFLRWGKLGIPSHEPAIQNSESRVSNSQISPFAALAGAVAFEFSDLFITHFGNLNLIATAAWMPLVLLFYRRSVTDRRAGFAVIAGILLAISFYAGHIQAFLFIVLALLLFASYHLLELGNCADSHSEMRIGPLRLSLHPRLSAVWLLSVVAVVAFCLSAPALFPAAEFTQHTVRSEFTYEQAVEFSLPPAQLLGLFVPGFFGRGPQNAWGPWPRVEVGYIGILPLVLAFLALILRRDAAKPFAVFALVGLALSMGGYGILHGWLYQIAPGFGQLRAPARFVVIFDFGIAALAAFGFDALLRTIPSAAQQAFNRIVRFAPWAFLLIALAAGSTAFAIMILGQGQDAVLFQRISNAANAIAFFILLLALSVAIVIARATQYFRPGPWAIAALALIFFDLFSLGAYVDISADDPSRVFDHPGAVDLLKNSRDLFRVDPRGTGVDAAWTADTALVHDMFSVDGDNPLVLSDFEKYWNGMGSRSSALYDLLNVKYLIGRKGVPLDQAKFKLAFEGDPTLDMFENVRVLPRAFIVAGTRVVPDHAAAFDAIHAADFDPTKTVVLEGVQEANLPSSSAPNASVTITGFGPNSVVLETDSSTAGILLTSEVYFPGWRAWVDDREVAVLRADYLFRAVELPAGAHRVTFAYDPISFKIGLALFGATLIALSVWGFAASRRV